MAALIALNDTLEITHTPHTHTHQIHIPYIWTHTPCIHTHIYTYTPHTSIYTPHSHTSKTSPAHIHTYHMHRHTHHTHTSLITHTHTPSTPKCITHTCVHFVFSFKIENTTHCQTVACESNGLFPSLLTSLKRKCKSRRWAHLCVLRRTCSFLLQWRTNSIFIIMKIRQIPKLPLRC